LSLKKYNYMEKGVKNVVGICGKVFSKWLFLKVGEPMANDVFRVIDYLKTRQDVVSDKIGMIGPSMEGLTFLSAAYDKRIKVAIL